MVDTSVTGRLIDSFQTIAQQELKKAGFDKTIQAQILSCEDPVIGKYRCRYQDANIIAYSSSPEISYTKGTYVSIMVPNGDMKKDKIILSASDKFSVSYKNQTGSQYQKYNIIGNNCITSNDKFYLLTNNIDYKYAIYKYNNTNPNDIQIDTYALEQYLKQSGSFIAAATIKTSIPVQQQSRGHYGITFNLCFKENGSDQEVIRSYTIDEDSMEGNPYRLIYDTRQYSIFKIDGVNFKRVDSIEIFNSGFPGADQNVPTGKLTSGNIEISLLEILGADRMTENQINGTAISFDTPQGTFFNNHSQSGDYRTIIAQIKIKGKILTENENIPFYWGREGTDVNSNSPYYNKHLGRGWRCLNESNLIAQGTDSADRVVQWVPSTNTYVVNLNEATARDNKFKVAVVYDNRVLTKQINIQNLAVSSPVITIQSSDGNQFYYDIGHPTLTCKVNGNQQPSYIYHWAYISNMGSFQYLPQQSSQLITEGQRVIGNKIYDVKISRITDYGTFKCTVYNQNIYLGTATITLLNSLIGGEEDFSLIINHGSATYQYNENGVAPNSKGLLEPQQQNIEDLSFTLYDNEGIVVQDASEARVRWAFPINDTMLVDLNYDENLPPDEDENYRYYNTQTISYDILPQYNINKQRNQIILIINYKGIVLTAQTSFTFIKQGQPGTNGTEYLVKLVLNTLTSYVPLWPVVTKTPTKYIVNYGIGTDSSQTEWDITESKQFFKAQLWKNGQKIWEGVQGSNIQGEPSEVTWSILKNIYGSNSTDISNFEIDSIVPGGIRYISANEILGTNDPIKPRANIVQCAIKIQNKIYYGTIPILTAWVSSEDYRVDLKDYSGFRYVLYTSDGVSPQYDSANPFEFMCQEKNSSNQWEDVNGLTYSVTPLGNYLKPSDSSQESAAYLLKIVDSIDNKYKVQPNFTYNGLCVNTSLYCQYYDQNDTKIAELCVPIHFLLNKYGLSNLNDWNGNSIQIDTDGGFILSPQIGAGHKQGNNGFTGVLMGDVKMPGKDNTDAGLMGFGNGIRTFFLNSDNGSAILGAGTGQIIIDPSAGKSMIYSHNFWKPTNYGQDGLPIDYTSTGQNPNGAGLLINLTTPEIRFGSGNFSVNSQGILHATGADISGDIYADSLTLSPTANRIPFSYVDNLSTTLQTLKNQIDSKIQTFYQNTDPSSNWTTTTEKATHIGDFWYNTAHNLSGFIQNATYRYDLDSNSNTYKWFECSVSSEIFDKLNGKATVFYGTPTDIFVPSPQQGDYLINSINEGTYKYIKINNVLQWSQIVSFMGYIKEDGTVGSQINEWEDSQTYTLNTYVQNQGKIYKCIQAHVSSSSNAPSSSSGAVYWDMDISGINVFLVSNNGLLTASNAIIYGTIYASDGMIGGLKLSGSSITSNNHAFALNSDGTGHIGGFNFEQYNPNPGTSEQYGGLTYDNYVQIRPDKLYVSSTPDSYKNSFYAITNNGSYIGIRNNVTMPSGNPDVVNIQGAYFGYIPYQLDYSSAHPWGGSQSQNKWGLLFDEDAGIWVNGDLNINAGYKSGIRDKLGKIELRTFKTYLTLPSNYNSNQTITFGGAAPMVISTGYNDSIQNCNLTISSARDLIFKTSEINSSHDYGNIQFYTEKTDETSGNGAHIRISGQGNRLVSMTKSDLGTNSNYWKNGYIQTIHWTNEQSLSDRKQKDILGKINFAEDLIMSLQPISFMWKNGDHRRTRMGFIAQDVAKICKNLNQNLSLVTANYINEDPDENIQEYFGEQVDDNLLSWGLSYDQLIAPIIVVLQNQQNKIINLEKQIKELKGEKYEN